MLVSLPHHVSAHWRWLAISLMLLAVVVLIHRALILTPSTEWRQDPLPVQAGHCAILTELATNWYGFAIEQEPVANILPFTGFASLFREQGVSSKAEAQLALTRASGIVSVEVFKALDSWLTEPGPFDQTFLDFLDRLEPARSIVPPQRRLANWPGRPWLGQLEVASEQTLCALPGTPPGTYQVVFGRSGGLADSYQTFFMRGASLSTNVIVGE